MSGPWCFVLPRYFEGIAGGAETLMGALAEHLAMRGDTVEIVTTCARDNRTWNNELPEGAEVIRGIPVRRFPVEPRNLERWIPLQLAIHDGKTVSTEDQLDWMQESVNSFALYRYLAARSEEFRAMFFGPYLFGTTFWGSLIDPSRSVLIPCLHDESYAYQDVIGSMFRQVRGCLFNAEPEMHLAGSLYGDVRGGVVGMGFTPPSEEDVAALEPYFDESFPYILYLGRKETGKNVQLLIDYFCAGKNQGLIPANVKLAILGGGSFEDLHRPAALARGDVIDLPHLSEREKQRLLKHALYLCQPSKNESFSIVLMEAWMVRTPVVVHSGCPVTRHHVVESGGGLYFAEIPDLAAVTRYFLDEPASRAVHADAGLEYVRREYSWASVLERFDRVTGELFDASLSMPT
jgi:glycosyltransferase involved in cell wall biosynthesis